MNEHDKHVLCIAALRKIAMSYRERIDRNDTSPYVFADQILAYIGEDIETNMPEADRLPDMFLEFHVWRKTAA